MSSTEDSSASLPVADRLVAACWNRDLPSAQAAIADGASVTEPGKESGWGGWWLPLKAAVYKQHLDLVVWLLSLGADPNSDGVMYYGAGYGTPAILQLLIDAGGDVNRESRKRLPLTKAAENNRDRNAQVLLAQPALDFTVTRKGKTPEQWARDERRHRIIKLIEEEVRGRGREQVTRWGERGQGV